MQLKWRNKWKKRKQRDKEKHAKAKERAVENKVIEVNSWKRGPIKIIHKTFS